MRKLKVYMAIKIKIIPSRVTPAVNLYATVVLEHTMGNPA